MSVQIIPPGIAGGGSGVLNTIPKWTPNSWTLGNSNITDDGTTVVVNSAARVTGSTQLGATGATTLAHVINGSIGATCTNSTTVGVGITYTPSAGTTTGVGAMFISMAGTANTTAGALTFSGINLNATTTRSAGANDLFVNGINITASGGTNVRGARIAVTGSVPTSYGVFVTNASTAGTATGIDVQVTGAATTNSAAVLTATGATTNNALQTVSGDVRLATTGGNVGIGYSAATSLTFKLDVSGTARFTGNTTIGTTASTNQHSINGWVLLTASQTSANNAFQINYSPVASTNGQSAFRVLDNGTFDTTAGALFTWAIRASATATRSAGANNLTNICGEFTATGAQSNIALQTIDGNVRLNTVSGTTTVGFTSSTALALVVNGTSTITSSSNTNSALAIVHTGANNSAVTSTYSPTNSTVNNLAAFSMGAAGTYDTTAGSLNAYGLNLSAAGSRSAGAFNFNNIALICGAANGQTNTAIRTTTGDNQLNFTSGNCNIGTSGGTAKLYVQQTSLTQNATTVVFTPVASTTNALIGISAIANGTFDTTAGALITYGSASVISSARSAGANSLTNVAHYASASGAQNNIAFQSNLGANYFNTGGDSFGVGYALNAALPAKFSVTGGIYASGDIEIDGALNHDGTTVGLFAVAPATQQTITGSRAGNAALADLLTKGALNGYWIDGTTA